MRVLLSVSFNNITHHPALDDESYTIFIPERSVPIPDWKQEVKKYLAVKKNSVTIGKKKIEQEKLFDGKWVLTTNTDLPASEVALQYNDLWMVEYVFYAKLYINFSGI